ncbi:MAG: hypothetical protein Q7S48_05150 [bacterium]|nr:hypothetical protein [bacterium]
MKRLFIIAVILVVTTVALGFVFGRKIWYKNIRQCPEWIDCMPVRCMDIVDGKLVETPYGSNGCGECKIPKGCTGFTETAN